LYKNHEQIYAEVLAANKKMHEQLEAVIAKYKIKTLKMPSESRHTFKCEKNNQAFQDYKDRRFFDEN